jgi:hypothetical protein
VKSILEHGLDREPVTEEQTTLRLAQAHPHLRGAAYYSEP